MPAEERSYGCEAIARINLALVRIRDGDLDAHDLRPVLDLPGDKRIAALPQRLAVVRAELAHRAIKARLWPARSTSK